jgi:hypothetical protein
MKFSTRLVGALLALFGIIVWTAMSTMVIYFIGGLASNGDGSGAGQGAVGDAIFVVGMFLWALPTTAFVFMILSSFNRLQGIMRRVGYGRAWAVLVFLVLGTGLLFISSGDVPVLWWTGLGCLLVAMFLGYAFFGIPPGNKG